MTYKQQIIPTAIISNLSVSQLIDQHFTAYNSARIREACQLMRSLLSTHSDVTIATSISGALTPAGFGTSIFAPLMRYGVIDWIICTGANLYHDLHYALKLKLFASQPNADDIELRKQETIRIYDLVFGYDVLLKTDSFLRELLKSPVFQKEMSSAEFHYHLGEHVFQVEEQLGVEHGLLATAWECGVPIYTSSPGDSSIGMNVAAIEFLEDSKLRINPNLDVTETTAIVYGARYTSSGKSGVLICGGGSPKNFLLQTQPQIHEVLGLEERGHDYFIQITDARPDTGGLSGATPSEAVSWGKVDPDQLPNSIVCYADTTVVLPLLTSYIFQTCEPRPLKKLYHQLDSLVERLRKNCQTS